MAIDRHPQEETLVRYAAGTLDPSLAYVVDAHLDDCPRCRRRLGLALETGGQLLDGLAQPTLSGSQVDAAWPTLLGRLETPDLAEAAGRPSASGVSPAIPVEQLRERLQGKLRWGRLAPGIEQCVIHRSASGGWIRLFRSQPGSGVPMHTHSAEEFSTVLQGSYVDENGHFGVGDFCELNHEDSHHPVVDSDVPCIALIAVSGTIRFRNPLIQSLARFAAL